MLIDESAYTRFEFLLRWSSLPSAHFRVLFVVNVEQTWLSNVASEQKAVQTNKQIKQTNKTTSMSYSHIVLELAPILNTFVCVWWVRSHIVCNVRTQMHADRNSARPMHAYMKHAMCEHRSMQTGTVQGANTYACRGRVWGLCQLRSVAISLSRIKENYPMYLWVHSHAGVRSHPCLHVCCSSLLFCCAAVRCSAKQC